MNINSVLKRRAKLNGIADREEWSQNGKPETAYEPNRVYILWAPDKCQVWAVFNTNEEAYARLHEEEAKYKDMDPNSNFDFSVEEFYVEE